MKTLKNYAPLHKPFGPKHAGFADVMEPSHTMLMVEHNANESCRMYETESQNMNLICLAQCTSRMVDDTTLAPFFSARSTGAVEMIAHFVFEPKAGAPPAEGRKALGLFFEALARPDTVQHVERFFATDAPAGGHVVDLPAEALAGVATMGQLYVHMMVQVDPTSTSFPTEQ